jgi:hypothetical protein
MVVLTDDGSSGSVSRESSPQATAGRVKRAESNDQKGDDDEDAHGAAPFEC